MSEDKDVSEDENKINKDDIIASARQLDEGSLYASLSTDDLYYRYENSPDQRVNQRRFESINPKGLEDHYSHKKYWSYFLMFLITALLACEYFLLFGVGTGFFDFLHYQWLLPTLLLQTLLQIFALAVIVVKSLFSEKSG